MKLVGITLAGIFDRVGDAWREPVNAPNGGYTKVSLDGVEISARSTTVKSHTQSLNLENAVYERETAYESQGKTLTVRSTRFLSADKPNLGVIQYSVTCDQPAKIRISTGIDYNVWDLNGPHLKNLTPKKSGDVLTVSAAASETSKKVAVAEIAGINFGNRIPRDQGQPESPGHRPRRRSGKNLHVSQMVRGLHGQRPPQDVGG